MLEAHLAALGRVECGGPSVTECGSVLVAQTETRKTKALVVGARVHLHGQRKLPRLQ